MELMLLDLIQKLRTPLLDSFFAFLTTMGNHGEIWFVFIIAAFLKKETRKIGYLAIFALIIEVILVSGIIKPIVMRPRPFIANPAVQLIVDAPKGASFPSGHAASSFAVAMVFYFSKFKLRKTMLSVAILMAASRLYVYVHYPSDILVGALIGTCIAYVLVRYQDAIFDSIDRILVRMGLLQSKNV